MLLESQDSSLRYSETDFLVFVSLKSVITKPIFICCGTGCYIKVAPKAYKLLESRECFILVFVSHVPGLVILRHSQFLTHLWIELTQGFLSPLLETECFDLKEGMFMISMFFDFCSLQKRLGNVCF